MTGLSIRWGVDIGLVCYNIVSNDDSTNRGVSQQ